MDTSTDDVKIDGEVLAQDFRFMYGNSFPSMAVFDVRCFNNQEMDAAYLDEVELTGEVAGLGRAVSYRFSSAEFNLRRQRSPTISGWNRSDQLLTRNK